jgi:3-oxoacyl-[acyl-carrier-protein] synthase-3
MTTFSISGVRIAGVASAVPRKVRTAKDEAPNFPGENIEKLAQSTGVVERHISKTLFPSDLGEAAARGIMSAMQWDKDSIDVLVFITQSSDYRLPGNACLLQARLGLSDECIAFDVNLGCSGYVYGLAQVGGLLSSMGKGRALLVVGDSACFTSPLDKSTVFLFGDGVSATALERDLTAPPMHFVLGTDGRGAQHLIIPAGGARCRPSPETSVRKAREGGNVRSDEDLYMNGAEIFAFTLRAVPDLVRKTMTAANWNLDTVDYFVFHQANALMLKLLGKKCGVPEPKMPLSLGKFGNTSGASIPVTMTACLSEKLTEPQRLLLVGFGVGLSWGGAAVQTAGMVVPEMIYVEEPQA